ncbi:hypothetical protein DH09_14775 [Bacillaceae bacterium JMAK1]|nr:hypothetical protein DH09_14775 [Bacillaceae bacterium JMAK1]
MHLTTTILRRTLLALLVGAALYVTYNQLTGLTHNDWYESNTLDTKIHEQVIQEASSEGLQIKENASVREAVAQIEEFANFDAFPTQRVMATGYTAGIESTGKEPDHPAYGLTYSGVPVSRDVYSTIAADPDVFPIGTVLFIPGYGYGVVADTGSAIQGEIIDLYYDTVEDVFAEWGKKEVDVYIMQEGNGQLSEDEFRAFQENRAVDGFTPPV